jgi:lactoylglutathione lyase
MKVSAQRFNRWAQFNFNGKCIALFNPKYDEELIYQGENLEIHYDKQYLEYRKNKKIHYGNNFVLNFYIDDLNAEYKRIKNLNMEYDRNHVFKYFITVLSFLAGRP